MIDTAKYEGHAPAPWEWKPTGEVLDTGLHIKWLHISDYGWVDYVPPWEPTGLLLADAPLLLEEVKQLQKYKRAFDRLYKMADADPGWKELMDDIWEMIE